MICGQGLRYKDYQLMKKEEVGSVGMSVERGEVVEVATVKEFAALLVRDGNGELYRWWRVGMGYAKDQDDE
jgi:hypothetical protein